MNRIRLNRIRRGALIATVLVSVVGALTGYAATASPAAPQDTTPTIARAWVRAWNGDDPAALGALFTSDARYRDVGVLKTSIGPAAITAWKAGTNQLISGATFTLDHAFEDGDSVAIVGTYRGRISGATSGFEVPMTTVLRVRGSHIAADTDYYNLADLLRQSGLPATWTPPTGNEEASR